MLRQPSGRPYRLHVLHPGKKRPPRPFQDSGRAKINRRYANLDLVHDLRQPIGDLRIGVRLNKDHVTEQNVHREIPFALGRSTVDVIDADLVPMWTDRRSHRPAPPIMERPLR